MIKVINNKKILIELKEDWDRLYNPKSHTIFQSFSYIYNCSGYLNNLFILIYKENSNNETKAILPLYLNKKKELRFINDNNTDFCDIIYDPTINLIDVIQEFIYYINTCKDVQSVVLNNLISNSPLLSYIKIFEIRSYIYSSNEYSYLNCTKSLDPLASLKHLKNKKIKKLKEILANCENLNFVVYNKENSIECPIADLKYLYNNMVNKGIRKSKEYNQEFWDFISICFNSNIIEISILKDKDGQPLSAGLVFCNKFNVIRWIIFYIDPKYNLWNNVCYLNFKSSLHDLVLNFGRGGYDYKINNFKPDIGLLYKISYSKTFFGQLRVLLDFNFYYIKKILKLYLKK